jgi:sn-glycerol 3-phosphate transport system permease protein
MYFWPLIISSTDNSLNTLQTAVFALQSNEGTDPGLLLAGITITLVPTLLLIVFGQRLLVRGFMAGAVK